MTSLDDLRSELERIDAELVELLARRFRVVQGVAEVKAVEGIPVVLPDRIAHVQALVAELAKQHGLDPAVAQRIYSHIIDEAIGLENRHIAKD
jgi:chorismate mutase-like protein